MKLKNFIALSLIILTMFIVYACSEPKLDNPQQEPLTEPEDTVEEQPEEEPVEELREEEPKEETCSDKAVKLIPETLSLILPSSYNPNTTGWQIEEDSKWEDGSLIDFKGEIEFQKGRYSGENTNYWYTRNIQNEKLFGEGGLKYSKQVTTIEGITGKNEFLIKVDLNPILIVEPTEPFDPYRGSFEIIDIKFVECRWIE
ncbi:MAG: hypothetical protein KAK00_06730 [Nanoarchaeota archaeon]|nr:hypothetical protein [Nanoarchaeota archaeon]